MITAATRLITEKADFRPALSSLPFAGALPERMMATYWEKLKDPRWQRKRLEIMNRAGFVCERCDDATKTLNVHHKLYRKGASPWDYSDEELACLCEDCHALEHSWRERLAKALASDHCTIESVVGFVEGHLLLCNPDQPDQYRLTIESFEHADGIADAFRISVQDVFDAADEKNVVNGRVLWAAHNRRWPDKRGFSG